MDYLPENIRKAFEQYIAGNKKEAFESLIPGTKYHQYLWIIDEFKRNKGKITKETKEMIEKFKKVWPGIESERLELQSLLLSFDSTNDSDEKNKIISQIDKVFIHGYYDYTKPAEVKAIPK